MTLYELKKIIDDCMEYMDGDTPVKLAAQPSWPFEYSISDVVIVDDDSNPDRGVVYIAEGQQLGY